ncbi:putative dinucleotide-binding enzyme [Catenulispora sp. EB89]|uniref:NADPH-dependent F420 reductase n=1 Tax=Catenulispora sp. EB89 TaxID=3156257 RepID=UPI0035173D8E
MRTISIIGLGTMAAAIGARAVRGGNLVEVTGRDSAKAEDLAKKLGGGATAGAFGAVPAGDIVILAVPHAAAAPILAQYGDALAGKIIVDISNPLTEDLSAKVTPGGVSAAQLIAQAAPASARVVKAFDVVFGEVLADPDRPADVLIAGDDAHAKADVSAFIETLGLRPLDTGDLTMAEWLEGAALLIIGLAKQRGNADFTLGVGVPR